MIKVILNVDVNVSYVYLHLRWTDILVKYDFDNCNFIFFTIYRTSRVTRLRPG